MPGLREAGILGVAAALTGGATYVVWSLLSASRKQEQAEEEISEETVKDTCEAAPVVSEVAPVSQHVLMLGLDGAGKTSLLRGLATGNLEQDVSPTEGINAVSINKENLRIEFLEVGGAEHLRTYWKRYLSKAQVLVYVVDSADVDRLPLAKRHLHDLLCEDPSMPLVVLANKQDVEGACGITDLHDSLALGNVGDGRKLFLISTHVTKGDPEIPASVQDARDLIFHVLSGGR